MKQIGIHVAGLQSLKTALRCLQEMSARIVLRSLCYENDLPAHAARPKPPADDQSRGVRFMALVSLGCVKEGDAQLHGVIHNGERRILIDLAPEGAAPQTEPADGQAGILKLVRIISQAF